MIVITVSTKYHDLLEFIIPQNLKFFKRWYIITYPDDRDTIQVVEKFQSEKIILVYYNFYNKKIFDKGGAIRHVQTNHLKDYEGIVLLLDSDIYLPNNFGTIIESLQINMNTLYGAQRYDFYTFENFQKDHVDEIYLLSFMGYFQLYHHKNPTHYLYSQSNDASMCDYRFSRLFKQKIIIKDLIVKHLGRKCVNWNGRKQFDFF